MVEEERTMTLEEPYFTSNPEWYKFDEENHRLVLTDKAPRKAVESYKKFYTMHDSWVKRNATRDMIAGSRGIPSMFGEINDGRPPKNRG